MVSACDDNTILADWPLLADTVEKVFSAWRTKFSEAADAFRA
jgi:hypothetical protein